MKTQLFKEYLIINRITNTMRTNEKDEVIITKRKAAEIFLVLSNAKYKLNGKVRTLAEKYWKEFEVVLGLTPY